MFEQLARIPAWRADLAAIVAEIDAGARPTPRRSRKPVRKLKPLWEE